MQLKLSCLCQFTWKKIKLQHHVPVLFWWSYFFWMLMCWILTEAYFSNTTHVPENLLNHVLPDFSTGFLEANIFLFLRLSNIGDEMHYLSEAAEHLTLLTCKKFPCVYTTEIYLYIIGGERSTGSPIVLLSWTLYFPINQTEGEGE